MEARLAAALPHASLLPSGSLPARHELDELAFGARLSRSREALAEALRLSR